MKINLSEINRDQFYVNENVIAGETVYLVTPKQMGAEWTSTNLHLRSSVWNSNGELISASFPKFFNFGEKPSLYPNPENFNDWKATEKLDGSTLIVSKYKGQLIARTRGTVDASKLELSGHEIELLKKKYSRFFDDYFHNGSADTYDYSVIFEWITPANQIVIKYSEPDLVLIAIVMHEDYSLKPQAFLDKFARVIELKRPRVFEFNTLAEMTETVSKFSDMEGVCLYYNNDQNIVKSKGDWYCKCHKLKAQFGSISQLFDVYCEVEGFLSGDEFFEHLANTFDFELATQAKTEINLIGEAYNKVQELIVTLDEFYKSNLIPLVQKYGMNSRKACATEIFKTHKDNANVLFKMLDGVNVAADQIIVHRLMKRELGLE